ncbi:MAG: hypothetical protein OXC54_12330 [Rhodospirillaceae bacterium]|nr:hypothetical protein [Rhodospirillaceae bacterium]
MVAHQLQQFFGSGAVSTERSEAPCYLEAALAGLEALALAFDADRLATSVKGLLYLCQLRGRTLPVAAAKFAVQIEAALEAEFS